MSSVVEIGGPPQPVSYSQFRTWISCQERFRQLKLLLRKRLPGWAMVGGSAVHRLTEEWEMAYSCPTEGIAA